MRKAYYSIFYVLLCAITFTASAQKGKTGDLSWSIFKGTLTIVGIGAMPDYKSPEYTPWFSHRNTFLAVVIGNSVTTIGNYAFSDCNDLIFVTIPNSIKMIGDNAFKGCGLTSISIPHLLTTIGNSAFWDCRLTSVSIPASVTEIGFNAFNHCEIHVDAGNTVYSSIDGELFNKDKTILFIFPCGKAKSYHIPTSVNSLGFRAFSDCRDLISITIPATLTNLGEMTFAYCDSLLEIINYAATPQKINIFVFGNADKNKCTLRVPVASLNAYRTAEGWREFENIEALKK